MARRRPDLGIPRRPRPGVIEGLIEGAEELVQSVAVEVVPPVVDALDVDALLAKIDINALMERIDLDALLARTEIGGVVSRSASAVAARSLDFARSQGVGIDTFIDRWTTRLLHRGRQAGPAGPPLYFKSQSGTAP